jgi:hypothetical protein
MTKQMGMAAMVVSATAVFAAAKRSPRSRVMG